MPRILIVNDQDLIRRGIRGLLIDTPFRHDFGEAATGAEALALLAQRHWDAVVLDLALTVPEPLDVLRRIKTAYPRVPVIVLSLNNTVDSAVLAFRHGASASIPPRQAGHLLPALRHVLNGKRYIQEELAERLAEEFLTGEGTTLHDRLTLRELEVLRRIASGISNGVIAGTLCISTKTVSAHRRNILQKLGLATTGALTLYAVKHGLIEA